MIEGNDNHLDNDSFNEDDSDEDSDSDDNEEVTLTQVEYNKETNFWFKKVGPLVKQVSSKFNLLC